MEAVATKKERKTEIVKPTKALRQDLQAKKDHFEALGWKFKQAANQNWNAEKHFEGQAPTAFNNFAKLEDLFSNIELSEQFSNGEVKNVEIVGKAATGLELPPPEAPEGFGEKKEARFIFLPETVTQSCKVLLTEKEIAQTWQEFSATELLLRAEKDTLEQAKARFKAESEKLESKKKFLFWRASSGYEYRDVSCREVVDKKRDLVIINRNDTGEEVGTRSVTKDDLQKELFD